MISDEIGAMLSGIPVQVARTMDQTAENMVRSMKERLEAGDHIDTGRLIGSISADTELSGNEIITDINITAKSEEGTWYAEFLEYGTGIYNESGNGRQTPWAWQDRDGNWHTTRGMHADPFIRPSIAEHIGELDAGISHDIGDLKRYKQ